MADERDKSAGGELVITRVFDAPRELVFNAWTDPDHLMKWWGPVEYPVAQVSMDVRPGGHWRHCLRSVETGEELWHSGVFREVVVPERLVFTFAWEEDGERGFDTLITVTFEEQGGKTLLTFRQSPFPTREEREGHREGWTSAFGRLDEYLANTDIDR